MGIETETREAHCLKAYDPIPVTVEGINTVTMIEHPKNALVGMDVSRLVMVMSVLLPHDEQLSQG